MNVQLTEKVIQMLCGQTSYDKGEAYYRAGKVTITYYDPETLTWEATVKVNGSDEVTIEILENGDVEAECSCPTLASYDKYCSHIAAVLLSIKDNPSDFGRSLVHSGRSKAGWKADSQSNPALGGTLQRFKEPGKRFDAAKRYLELVWGKAAAVQPHEEPL